MSLPQPLDPVGALMEAGDAAERAGDSAAARRYLEQALALDAARLGLRERLAALTQQDAPAPLDATLTTHGATLGAFRLEQQVGRGGTASVYAAIDVALGRRVALKVYRRRGPLERARLFAEGRAAASVDHPGVVRVLDIDPTLGALALEWLPGPRRGDLAFLLGAVEALAAVHAAGLVHRDIKPSNLLARDDGRAVLIDFGLALPIGDTPPRAGEGSPGYVAREQWQGAAADPRSDVYALGLTLRELAEDITGDLALSLPALHALLEACLDEHPEARPSLATIEAALLDARTRLADSGPSR